MLGAFGLQEKRCDEEKDIGAFDLLFLLYFNVLVSGGSSGRGQKSTSLYLYAVSTTVGNGYRKYKHPRDLKSSFFRREL